MNFAAGQRWTYRAPAGFEASRIVIGAVVTFGNSEQVVCVAVSGAPKRSTDGGLEAVVIPFLPLSLDAFAATVVEQDGSDLPPPSFATEMDAWVADPRGLSTFSVPFEGSLETLIARQMAQIVLPNDGTS